MSLILAAQKVCLRQHCDSTLHMICKIDPLAIKTVYWLPVTSLCLGTLRRYFQVVGRRILDPLDKDLIFLCLQDAVSSCIVAGQLQVSQSIISRLLQCLLDVESVIKTHNLCGQNQQLQAKISRHQASSDCVNVNCQYHQKEA